MERFKVITLSGSSRFKDEFFAVEEKLTLEGNLVISLSVWEHAGSGKISEKTKQMLAKMHRQKIDMADELFVINKNGYIGESTKAEIEYARATGKPVRFLEPQSPAAK